MELIKSQKDDISLDELSGQLNKEAESRAVLVIRTVFGEKTFYCSDIRGVLVDRGDGKPEDITESILKGFQKKEEVL